MNAQAVKATKATKATKEMKVAKVAKVVKAALTRCDKFNLHVHATPKIFTARG